MDLDAIIQGFNLLPWRALTMGTTTAWRLHSPVYLGLVPVLTLPSGAEYCAAARRPGCALVARRTGCALGTSGALRRTWRASNELVSIRLAVWRSRPLSIASAS